MKKPLILLALLSLAVLMGPPLRATIVRTEWVSAPAQVNAGVRYRIEAGAEIVFYNPYPFAPNEAWMQLYKDDHLVTEMYGCGGPYGGFLDCVGAYFTDYTPGQVVFEVYIQSTHQDSDWMAHVVNIVPVNPANRITVNNTGTATVYNDTPVVVSATVTPPDFANYTYGMRILKWTGPAGAQPGVGGAWDPVPVHEVTAPLSGQCVWSATILPAPGDVPAKVAYRLFSWHTGAPEYANPADCVVNVPNRAPHDAIIGIWPQAIEYGQNVEVTGMLMDMDGNLHGHSLWVIAPAADGSKNPVEDCYSRPLNPDWWGDPRISEAGWSGPWENGHPSNGAFSTIDGVFTPSRCGVWQLRTNGCDTAGVWGPGDTKDLVVAKATPGGTYMPSVLLQYAGLTAAHLNATFANPHNGASVAGVVSYHLVESGTLGQTLEPGTMLDPGTYTVRASISTSDNYNAAHVDAALIVDGDPNGHNNGNDIPNWIENELGLNPSAPNDANGDLEINIHTPVN